MLATNEPRPPFAAGIWVPIVTPFQWDEVDYRATARLVRRLAQTGVAGLVACGTTGEGPALTTFEKARLLDVILEAAGDMPVLLALEGANTAKLVADLREIGPWPVRGYLLPAPSYVRPAEDGVRRHLLTVADAADGPVMIYDIPARTGCTLSIDLIARLAETGPFPAIKACGFDEQRLTALVGIPNLTVFSGDDTALFRALQLGAQGAVSASANVISNALVALYEACLGLHPARAERLWHQLLPITQLLFAEPNPAPVKAVLAAQGLLDDGLRLPLTPCTAGLRNRLAALVNAVNRPYDAIEPPARHWA